MLLYLLVRRFFGCFLLLFISILIARKLFGSFCSKFKSFTFVWFCLGAKKSTFAHVWLLHHHGDPRFLGNPHWIPFQKWILNIQIYSPLLVTVAHNGQKVKMRFSVLGISNEKYIFTLRYSFRHWVDFQNDMLE